MALFIWVVDWQHKCASGVGGLPRQNKRLRLLQSETYHHGNDGKLLESERECGGDWRSTLLARAPQVVTFVLALALAAQLAFIVVAMTSRSRQAPPPPLAAVAAAARSSTSAALVNAHLFGNAAVQASGDAANAPPSSMPLVLAGVLATEDPKEGMAIIGESAQAAKVVAVGQQVPGGAQLHSVYSDRAIIDRGGTLESVFLPRQTGGGIVAAAPPPMPTAAAEGNEAMIDRMRKLVNDDPGLSARSCGRSRCSRAAK